MLSQQQTGAFIPAAYRHGGAAYARMRPVTPTFQTHSGLPCALHSWALPLSGAFLHSFPLDGSCSVTMETSSHHLTAAHHLSVLTSCPRMVQPHLNSPWGINPRHTQCLQWESFSAEKALCYHKTVMKPAPRRCETLGFILSGASLQMIKTKGTECPADDWRGGSLATAPQMTSFPAMFLTSSWKHPILYILDVRKRKSELKNDG